MTLGGRGDSLYAVEAGNLLQLFQSLCSLHIPEDLTVPEEKHQCAQLMRPSGGWNKDSSAGSLFVHLVIGFWEHLVLVHPVSTLPCLQPRWH